MEILDKSIGDVDVLCLCGRLDTYAASEVEKKLLLLTEKTQVCLVVNFEKLEYISSSGLRVLLMALKKARKQEGDMRFTGLQPFVKEVFDLSGFLNLFKIFDNEEEAIGSFQRK